MSRNIKSGFVLTIAQCRPGIMPPLAAKHISRLTSAKDLPQLLSVQHTFFLTVHVSTFVLLTRCSKILFLDW